MIGIEVGAEAAIQKAMDPYQVQQNDVLDLEVDRITAATGRQGSPPNIAENRAVQIAGHSIETKLMHKI